MSRPIMKLRVKRLHPDAVVPQYAKDGDAGLDLVAVDDGTDVFYSFADREEAYREYRTGLAVEIPRGFVGLIFPRSSITTKPMVLKNAVGVIDSGYRGEVRFRFLCDPGKPEGYYRKGDKIGQLIVMPYPEIAVVVSDELEESERGTSGFGSSGK